MEAHRRAEAGKGSIAAMSMDIRWDGNLSTGAISAGNRDLRCGISAGCRISGRARGRYNCSYQTARYPSLRSERCNR